MRGFFTSDPVADAEREQVINAASRAAWEEENPETEYLVEYTVTVHVLAKGRTREEARGDAGERLSTVMASTDIWDWDANEERIERF